MSGKLDQSLDQILAENKPTGGKSGSRPGRQARKDNKPAKGTTGGVQKNVKPAKSMIKGKGLKGPLPVTTGSKVIMSRLPVDVSEVAIKDFFTKAIPGHPIKKVLVSYSANGKSRGEATVVFSKPESAAIVANQMNGIKIDQSVISIEVVATPNQKSLLDRVTGPKPAGAKKDKAISKPNATNGAAKAKSKKGKKSGNLSRVKPKNSTELDLDMQDYMGDNGAATNGAVANTGPVTDAAMVDEVM